MATVAFASSPFRRLSLAKIDAVVSARLGPTRTAGNEQSACFNRQVAMYLAKHVGGWSTTVIGRFYNGRDQSTVCYGIQRIESLRESNPEVDALLSELKQQLESASDTAAHPEISRVSPKYARVSQLSVDELADIVAARICAYLEQRMLRPEPDEPFNVFGTK
jgi:hypothetical protein